MHETAFRLCELPLKLDNRVVVFVPGMPPKLRTLYVNIKSMATDLELRDSSVLEFYRERPKQGFVTIPDAPMGQIRWDDISLKVLSAWIRKGRGNEGDDIYYIRQKWAIVDCPHVKIEDYQV